MAMMSGHDMRKCALRRYIVFRVKAIEFLDLSSLQRGLRTAWDMDRSKPVPLPGVPPIRPTIFVSDSVRTVVLSWFCVFIDQSRDGMDVTKLWIDLFPQHKARVEETWV